MSARKAPSRGARRPSVSPDSRPRAVRPAARSGSLPTGAVRARLARVLVRRARAGTSEERQVIAGLLGELGGEAARSGLTRLLADPSDRVRRAAVLAVARSAGPEPPRRELARLRRFLRDPAPRVRGAAAIVLGRYRDRSSVPALIARLRAPGTWDKPSVAVALGRIGDRRALGALQALAATPQPWLRVCAIHALGGIGAPEGRPTVRAAADDPAWSVRGAAATALGAIGTSRDVPRLLRLADDPHPWPRRGALYALGRLHCKDAAARLGAALTDPSAEVRLAACWALGELGDPAARRPLAAFLAGCPLPGAAGPPAGSEAARALPDRGTDGRLFGVALAAIARLPAPDADAEVDLALADAKARLDPASLAAPVPEAFATDRAQRPPPTAEELFERARGVLPSGARR